MASQTGLVRDLNARMLGYPTQSQAYPNQQQGSRGSPLAQPPHADGVSPPFQRQQLGSISLPRGQPQQIDGVSPSIQMGAVRQEIARNLNFEAYPHYFPVGMTTNAHLHLEYFGPFTGEKQLWRQVPRDNNNGGFSVVGKTSDFNGNPPTAEKPAFIWIGMVPGPHLYNAAGTTSRQYNPHALRAVIKTPVKQGEWNLYGASNADVATGFCLLFKIESLLDVFWFRHPQIINKPPPGAAVPRNCVTVHRDGYCMIFAAKTLSVGVPSRVKQSQVGGGNRNAISSGNANSHGNANFVNASRLEQPGGARGIAGANRNGHATVNAYVKEDGKVTGKATGKVAGEVTGKTVVLGSEITRLPALRPPRKCCIIPPRGARKMVLRPRTGGISKSTDTKTDAGKVQNTASAPTASNDKSSLAKMKTRLSSLTAAEMAQVQKAQTDFLRRRGEQGVKKG